MILKNIINFFDCIYVILFFIYLWIVNYFFTQNNIRIKFFFFIILFFLTCFIGLYYNLDGIIMLFMICELSIILIFITLYSQLYSVYNKNYNNYKIKYFIIIVIIFNITHYSTNVIKYNYYYSYYNIIVNDFYYIFNFFFEKQIFLTIIITFIITLYSIFFILLFFNIKQLLNKNTKKRKNIYFIRKQNIIHQSNFLNKIRIFQN